MTLFEDIVDNIKSNGGASIQVSVYDDSAEISYIDSNGNTVEKHYTIVIGDDGSEDWQEVGN